MYPHSHFLFPFFIGELLVNLGIFTHEQAILTGFLGMLVDIDHYFYYAIKHKTFSLKNAWNAAVSGTEAKERTFIHHKKGFIIMTIFLTFLMLINFSLYAMLAIGYYTHIFLDWGKLNFLNWRKTFKFSEEGFTFQLSAFELTFDIVLIALLLYTML
uniref:Membrane-bound metal-dependent hydrolase n=1 Tax=uncultured marine group II/III euryarchaeote KM3_83_G03 TaxID=1456522 RepID=A0A075HQK0_9EURY|nr:hypothetical protein [uncultured marine group II/III euryarchaeote KM3_83_G03]